jgi:hypothetical protein
VPTLLFSAALTLLALLAPVALLAALALSAIARTRRAGLRLLAWEAAGAPAGAVLMVLLHLAVYHRLRAVTGEGLAFACGAGLTLGAVVAAVRSWRRRRAASAVHPTTTSPHAP